MKSQYGSYDIIKYPNFVDTSALIGKSVTFIENYHPGVSVRTILHPEYRIILSDWDANIICSISDYHIDAISLNDNIIDFAIGVGLKSYQIFFDVDLRIIDFISDIKTFISPQMLELMFPKFKKQNIIKTGIFDDKIDNHTSCVVKNNHNNKLEPLYAKIL